MHFRFAPKATVSHQDAIPSLSATIGPASETNLFRQVQHAQASSSIQSVLSMRSTCSQYHVRWLNS